MMYYNTGSICCEEKDLKDLVEIMNNANLDQSGAEFDVDDAYLVNGKYYFDINDCYGDIESSLDEIVEECEKNGIKIEFDISYSGDASGQYLYKDGNYEVLGEDETHLRNIDDADLIAEVKRRGLAQRIHDDVVRDFMAGGLVSQFDFSEGDAAEAAEMAYDHYANTEGATQYDGIVWAAEHWEKA